MAGADNPGNDNPADIRKDPEGQYRKHLKSSQNNGVASAKPRVITGSDDATAHKAPPGKPEERDWDINFDPQGLNEGKFRG
jgi:hypothetical protein